MDTLGSTAAIILAAGSSTRMGVGRHKLQLPLGDRPVLRHVVDATLASQAEPLVIVLGHQADQVATLLAPYTAHPRVLLVENANYQQGMSTSLRTGLRALMDMGVPSSTVDSVLILLGDQPLITPALINRMIATRWQTGKRIVTPLYEGRRGTPTLFERSLFVELMELTGDEGGRRVLEGHRDEIATIELSEAIASYDVDTWEAYQQVVAIWEQQHPQGSRDSDNSGSEQR